MDVTLRQIRGFVAVAELRSFTKASQILNISQPALTVQIRNLEVALGVKLLDRSSRSVEVTRIGHDLLPAIKRSMLELESVITDTSGMSSGRVGIVRIAALPSFAASFLPPVILSCRQANVALTFVVRDAIARQVLEYIRSDEVDIGITGGEVVDSRIEILHTTTDRLCVVCPAGHPFSKRKTLTAEDLVEVPLVLTNPGTSVRESIDTAFLAMGKTPTIACEVTYMMSAVAMVRAGLGVTILPASAREISPESGVRVRPIAGEAFVRPVRFVKKCGRTLPPATSGFLDACLKALTREPASAPAP